jgi:hypothetical protein
MKRVLVAIALGAAGFALRGLVAATPAAPPGASSDDPVRRIVDAGLASDGAYRKLAWLTDRIGPRLSGSENLRRLPPGAPPR